MVGSRTLTALAGIVASLALSALLYVYTDSLLFFLFVPFIPFLFARRGADEPNRPPIRECSRCDFATRNPGFEYCPRDGSRLYERTDDGVDRP
jgi:hypothetical protein